MMKWKESLTKDLDWKIGRNLAAFNDVLYGGFGAFEYEEPIEIIWKHSNKSKSDLGASRDNQTVFDIIIEIMKEHNRCISLMARHEHRYNRNRCPPAATLFSFQAKLASRNCQRKDLPRTPRQIIQVRVHCDNHKYGLAVSDYI